jgi:hypothetical protein
MASETLTFDFALDGLEGMHNHELEVFAVSATTFRGDFADAPFRIPHVAGNAIAPFQPAAQFP